jgi:aromatic-L-amino-acid/L-tryptophan decarboxylase
MNPLSLTPEAMRAFGYQVVDAIVDHFATVSEKPAIRRRTRAELDAALGEALPAAAMDPEAVLRLALEQVFTAVGHSNPRYFGYIHSANNFVSVMADALASGFTPFAGTWQCGSGCAAVEVVVLDWLKSVVGMPVGAGGLFTSGGSLANLIALGGAREAAGGLDTLGRQVLYCSDQTHSSMDRAARILGYRAEQQLRKIPADGEFRLPVAALRAAVAADRAAGLKPATVIANGGTTNTGAVDPLAELAALCRAEGLWLHVDGAFGAAAAFCERGRRMLEGMGEADSVSLDPHKWLFQPYAIGCLLARDPAALRRVFAVMPEYLRDAAERAGEVNFCDLGLELTRPFRALKLWMSLKVYGAEAFGAAIERGLALGEAAERLIREWPGGCWELVTPARMAVVTFRYVGRGTAGAAFPSEEELDALNLSLAADAAADGYCFVNTTVLRGRTVLRMCPIHPGAEVEDVRASLARLEELARWRACGTPVG